MNKKLVPLIIILFLLASGGYYLKTKNTGAPQTVGQTVSEAAEFAKAIESGKPTLCTLSKDSDTMEYFIKGKKMRANITTSIEGKAMLSHMIGDESYLYLWSADQKQGTKMSLLISPPPAVASPSETRESRPQLVTESDYQGFKDQGYTINCKSGSVDDSVFTPPPDIQFIDPALMMDNSQPPDMDQLKKLQEQYGTAPLPSP